MSTVAVNEITDEVGTGSPAFTNGLAQSDIAGALNATGTAPIYACRAWVNFDGTNGTIRDSGNVSSITKNGTGDYTVNFATAMPDSNYAISGWCIVSGQNSSNFSANPSPTYNNSSVEVISRISTGLADADAVTFLAIR